MIKIKDLVKNTTAQSIQQAINQKYPDHKYVIFNSFIFDWESDCLSVNESEYVYEFEIKVSMDDFKKDKHKKEKHLLLESKSDISKMPNKFYYACPKGIIPTVYLPAYAGLIEVIDTPTGMVAEVIKNAPFLHRENVFQNIKPVLLDKFYSKYIRTEYENHQLTKRITELEEQLKNVK